MACNWPVLAQRSSVDSEPEDGDFQLYHGYMEKNWYSFDEKLVVRHMVNFPSFYGYVHSSSSRMWCPRSIRPRSGAAVSGGGWKHTSQLWDIGTPEVKQGRRP